MFFTQSFRYLICLSFLFFSSCSTCTDATVVDTPDDAFVVVFMIKNDETEICQALDPYVKEGMQSFLIYDLLSTDKTVEVVKNYFHEHGIKHYHVFQEPCKENMVNSQNYALDLAEQCFPNAAFLFMPWDLKEQLNSVSKLQQFCREQENEPVNCYKILVNYLDHTNKRWAFGHYPGLIRAHTNTRFLGDLFPENHINEETSEDVYTIPYDIFFNSKL